jgi:hypothetical protein
MDRISLILLAMGTTGCAPPRWGDLSISSSGRQLAERGYLDDSTQVARRPTRSGGTSAVCLAWPAVHQIVGYSLNLFQSLGQIARRVWWPGRSLNSVPTAIERPWLTPSWQIPSIRQTGGARAVRRAQQRGEQVARWTLGEELWERFCQQGYLDLRSPHIPGLTYRLRVGRRVQLLWDSPDAARLIPWPYRGYLCINPTYSVPAVEFAAQLYLYLRDHEDIVIRVAIPQAADAPLRSVF